jgi:hypothetical protein
MSMYVFMSAELVAPIIGAPIMSRPADPSEIVGDSRTCGRPADLRAPQPEASNAPTAPTAVSTFRRVNDTMGCRSASGGY